LVELGEDGIGALGRDEGKGLGSSSWRHTTDLKTLRLIRREGGEQGGRALAFVVDHGPALAGLERKARLGAV
jgi:hypothetical protein